MFKKAREIRSHNRHREIFELKKQLTDTERKIGQLLDRIIEAESPSVVAAYEKNVSALEDDQISRAEKITNFTHSFPDFNGHSRTALQVLENPRHIWDNMGIRLEDNPDKTVFSGEWYSTKMRGLEPPLSPGL